MTDKEIEECFYNCIEYSNKIKNPILRKCCQEIVIIKNNVSY